MIWWYLWEFFTCITYNKSKLTIINHSLTSLELTKLKFSLVRNFHLSNNQTEEKEKEAQSFITKQKNYHQIFQLLDCNQAAFAQFSSQRWNQIQHQEIYVKRTPHSNWLIFCTERSTASPPLPSYNTTCNQHLQQFKEKKKRREKRKGNNNVQVDRKEPTKGPNGGEE